MESTSRIGTDRNLLGLAALSAVSAVLTGFVLIPAESAVRFVQHAGYYLILAGFVALAVSLIRLWRATSLRPTWERKDTHLALAALGVALLWQVNAPHGFKVLMDEFVLSSTAMSMHFHRDIYVPLKAHHVDGTLAVLGGIVDKRPNAFPLVLSLLHDFTGYRLANVFILNGVLSWGLLYLAGRLGGYLGGTPRAGMLALLLLASLPLLGLNATGAGFELMNLLMICGCMLLARRLLKAPDARAQDALLFATVILAQVRYESALFTIATGLLIVLVWIRQRRVIASWSLVLAPPLLLLVPLQNKVFELNSDYWQMHGTDLPFSIAYLTSNLGHAVGFLFSAEGYEMTSPILAGLGLVSTLFAFVFLLRRWRLLPEAEGATLGTFGLIVLANFLLLLCYHWGQLEDFVAARLALPLLLLFALASAFVMGRWIRTSRAWVVLLALPLTWTVLVALPVTARADSTGMFLPFREARWQLDFVRAHREKRAFFVMHSPHPAILLREPSTSIVGFAERPEQVDFHLREGTYNEIYVFQRLAFNPTKGTWAPAEDNELGPEFILETLEERRFQPFFRTRLSRLQAIDLSRKLPRPEGWKPAFPVLNLELDQKDTDPANQYVRKYLSQLP